MSVAVGAIHEAFAHVAVVVKLMLAGQFVNVGGTASVAQGSTTIRVTTTLNTQMAVLPLASVAIYLTSVAPIGKHEPLAPPNT